MLGALDEIADSAGRRAALAHFVGSVGADNARLLQQALAELPTGTDLRYPGSGSKAFHRRGDAATNQPVADSWPQSCAAARFGQGTAD